MKLKAPLKQDAERLARQARLADELGDIDKKLAPFRTLIAREEQIRKAIRAEFADSQPAEEFSVNGERFVVLVGARANERRIDLPKLWRLAGVAVMKKIASVTLKAVEQGVTPDIAASVVSTTPTGSRSLKIFERGVAA